MVNFFWALAIVSAAFLIANVLWRPSRIRRAADKRQASYSYNLSFAMSVYTTFAFAAAAVTAQTSLLFALGWAVSPIVFTLFLFHFFVWKRKGV